MVKKIKERHGDVEFGGVFTRVNGRMTKEMVKAF